MSNANVVNEQTIVLARGRSKADRKLFEDFRWVCRALCKDPTSPQLCQVLVDSDWVVATDGRRLHQFKNWTFEPWEGEHYPNLNKLKRTRIPYGSYSVLKNTKRELVLERIDEPLPYPDYKQLGPSATKCGTFDISTRRGSGPAGRIDGGVTGRILCEIQRHFCSFTEPGHGFPVFAINAQFVQDAIENAPVIFDRFVYGTRKLLVPDVKAPVVFHSDTHRAIICPLCLRDKK